MEKFYSSKTLLKMAGGGMHPPPPPPLDLPLMAAALMKWLELHLGDKLVNACLSSGWSTSLI